MCAMAWTGTTAKINTRSQQFMRIVLKYFTLTTNVQVLAGVICAILQKDIH